MTLAPYFLPKISQRRLLGVTMPVLNTTIYRNGGPEGLQILFICYSFCLVLMTKHKMTSPHAFFPKGRRGSNFIFTLLSICIFQPRVCSYCECHIYLFIYLFLRNTSLTSEQPHGLLRRSRSSLLTHSTHSLFPSSIPVLFSTMKTSSVPAAETGISS